MSRKPRWNHSPALKAEVALEWSGRRIEDLQFALAESLKRQVSAGLQLLKLSKLGSNSGRGLVRELCPRAAAPLIHLPLEPQRLIRQLGVGTRRATFLVRRRKPAAQVSHPESCRTPSSAADPHRSSNNPRRQRQVSELNRRNFSPRQCHMIGRSRLCHCRMGKSTY